MKRTNHSEQGMNKRGSKYLVQQRKSKMDKKERQQDEEKQVRPIQNFPDYLKYVAKKSKAGFGKVHEELYRIYSDSFSKTDKTVQQPRSSLYEQNPDTSKSKTALRKRWSAASGYFWSSTGHIKPEGHSFISYIPEESEDLGSSTSSDKTEKNYDLLSDEYDLIKQENKTLHADGTRSATVVEKDKRMFDFDSVRYSMPHSELTKEVIYANDRVLHVELLGNITEQKESEDDPEDDPSVLYAVPKKCKQRCAHELDDYINLRSPYIENQDISSVDAETDGQMQVKRIKDFSVLDTLDSNKSDSVDKGSNSLQSIEKRPPQQKLESGDTGDDGTADNDYLSFSQWTGPHDNKSNEKTEANKQKIYDEPANINGRRYLNMGEITELKGQAGNLQEVEDYYVPLSKWLDPDYENVPNEKTNLGLHEIITNKQTGLLIDTTCTQKGPGIQSGEGIGEIKDHDNPEETNYDRPSGWIQARNGGTSSTDQVNEYLLADDLYTKVVKRADTDLSDGDYSVPIWTRPVKGKNNSECPQPVPRISKINTNVDRTDKLFSDAKPNHVKNDSEFCNYSVDEIVECLNSCALGKLAKLCQQEQLGGESFRGLTADDLKKEPYLMNWFHISRLFKVIDGWRPRATSRAFKP